MGPCAVCVCVRVCGTCPLLWVPAYRAVPGCIMSTRLVFVCIGGLARAVLVSGCLPCSIAIADLPEVGVSASVASGLHLRATSDRASRSPRTGFAPDSVLRVRGIRLPQLPRPRQRPRDVERWIGVRLLRDSAERARSRPDSRS
ncbi:hypothetical protein BC628DRAFT_1401360 [Trametes gibbosa]|nr:hypothetical protein BC628DRAFT_1401360 [Trametes gibbosa]